MMFSSSSARRSGGSPRLDARGDIRSRVRQIREELLDLRERLLLGVGFVVDLAAFVHVHLGAAERLLVERLADGATHDGRPRGEDLGLAAHHHGEVRHEGESGRGARDRAHDPRRNGHRSQQLYALPPKVSGGEAHVPGGLVGLRAVAHPLDQLDVGNAVLEGERLHEVAGMLAHVVGTAAGDREVVTTDRHRAPVDLSEAHHVGAGREAHEVACRVVVGGADERTCLDEAPRVDHLLEALANGVAAPGVLPLDALGAAQLAAEATDVLDIGERLLPGQARLPALATWVDWHRLPLLLASRKRYAMRRAAPSLTARPPPPLRLPRAASVGYHDARRGLAANAFARPGAIPNAGQGGH